MGHLTSHKVGCSACEENPSSPMTLHRMWPHPFSRADRCHSHETHFSFNYIEISDSKRSWSPCYMASAQSEFIDVETALCIDWLFIVEEETQSAATDEHDLSEKEDLCAAVHPFLNGDMSSVPAVLQYNGLFAGGVWEFHPSVDYVLGSFIGSEDVIPAWFSSLWGRRGRILYQGTEKLAPD